MDSINPKVSIILPTYNGEKYIKTAINAILAQTYNNWELIIVDDCSTDNTNKIINEFAQKDLRIKVIRNEVNKKVAASLNIGFSHAAGDYYTWTSDDNYYKPAAIEKMVKFLQKNPDYGMVYAISDMIDENGKKYAEWGATPADAEKIFDANYIGACFLYTKGVAKKVGEYSQNLTLVEDHEYWIRIKLAAKITNIPESLYVYRLHSKSLTGQNTYTGRIKDFDMMFNYEKVYVEKFPELQQYMNSFMKVRRILRQKELVSIKELLKYLNKKDLYKELKTFYRFHNENYYLKYILQLGGIYLIKGIKQYIKCRKNRKNFYELSIRRYGDDRGYLTTIENTDIPFKIKRVYYLSDVTKGKDRAHHAHKKSSRVLSAIRGSVRVKLIDGLNNKTGEFVLNNPTRAVYFNRKVWCELSDFSDDAVVLALADEPYFEKEYIRNFDDYKQFVGGKK